MKESKIAVPKDKSVKKTFLKVGLKTKQRKESSSKNSSLKRLKKKPKIKPISMVTKSVGIPVLTSTKPTFILPNGHLIKIDTTPIIPQPQIIFDVPKILLLPEYKNSEVLIAPKKNDGTVTTCVNKRPIPSLATYNRLLKETNFLKDTKVEIANDVKLNRTAENKNESNKTQIVEKNIRDNKIIENDKHDGSEPVKSNDNKSTTSHTIEAIVKDINQDKNDKYVEREKIVASEIICDGSKNELKSGAPENIINNVKITTDVPECLPTTQTTSTVVNSLSILTEENQRKSMETAKNIMSCFDDIRLPIPNTDFSTDLFSSLQGPVGGHHADSMSPTEAFLLSFPLVSTSKNTNILNETEQTELHSATPTTILQIGNLESPATELFQKSVDDCEKDQNKDKMKDQFSFNDKPYYNNGYVDINKKNDQMYGYKEIKKLKAIPPPQPTASTYKTTYNDFSSYYKTTQSNSDLWRYTSYNSFDKNSNKNIKKTDKSTSTVFANNVPYVPYDLNTTTTTTYIDTESYHEAWPHKPKQKKKQNEKNMPVNWMTDKGCQNSYAKKDDYSYQKKNNYDMSFDLQPEPKQTYSWSPSKTIPLLPHLDTNMPSTLPTLVGDLALNITTGPNTPFDQRIYECNKKNDNTVIPVTSSEQNMFNYKSRPVNSNFLSVSQLVEQPKSNDKRKGRNCAKDYCCVYQNQKTDKDYYQHQTKQYYPEINTFEQDQSWVRSKYSHDSSRSTNHSAESLIRHQQKNGSIVKNGSKNQNLTNKQTACYRTGQKTSYNNNENFGNYYNQHNSNYLYDNRNDLDRQSSSTYQIPTNFYSPPTTTKHNISNYIPLPTTFSMTNSSYNKPVQHFTQNTNNYYNSSSNVNALTNFNLSTIFPEMIDKVIE